MTFYIRRRDNRTSQLETVDEFESGEEAKEMLLEYAMADPAGTYVITRKATKDWSLFEAGGHENCDCMDCRPWTY